MRALFVAFALLLVVVGCGDDDGEPVCGARNTGSCVDDRDCEGAVCAASFDEEPTLACRVAEGRAPGEACALSAECAHGICLVGGTCRRPCDDIGACEASERCGSAFATTASTTHPVRVCVPAIQSVAGFVQTSAELPNIELEGSALYLVEAPCDQKTVIERLTTERGVALFALDVPSFNPVSPKGPTHAFWIPSGSRVEPALRHRVEIPGEGRATVTRFAEHSGSVLDLDLFYIGLRELAPGSPEIVAALEELGEILAVAGISIGDVRDHRVVGDAAARFQILDREVGVLSELPDLSTLSAGVSSPSVSVYLLRSIDGALGVAGGIPGPLGADGRPTSGIAISAEVIASSGGVTLGRVIAHELGHYLGLFHTSEVDGSTVEAFDDTLVCGRDRDLDGDGLSVDECVGAGAENLMFWSGRANGVELSLEQRALLRRAPILRE